MDSPDLVLNAGLALAADPPRSTGALWYRQPATKWESDALPIGNGRLGAMCFGGTSLERIQFNEESLWTGGLNPSGAWTPEQEDANGFGCYRSFGDLTIFFALDADAKNALAEVSSPSGHGAGSGAGNGIENASDGKVQSTWCVEPGGQPVVWKLSLPKAQACSRYAFTSANDAPERDPSTWTLEGSADDVLWTVLDSHLEEASFANRHERREYLIANPVSCRHYRITFQTKGSHFQVAEIAFPDVTIGKQAIPDDYLRSLDLTQGLHTTTFSVNGITHVREAFTSQDSQGIILVCSASKPGRQSGVVHLTDANGAAITIAGKDLAVSNRLKNDLRYASRVAVLNQGGTVRIEGDAIHFQGCDRLVIALAARTDYVMDFAKGFRIGIDPAQAVAADLTRIAGRDAQDLKAKAGAECRSYIGRASLDLGPSPIGAALATDERLTRYARGEADPGLEATLWQFGRYLLAQSSRRGDLPANLQGVWCDQLSPTWASDYHTNINIQMNYWGAEVTNMGDSHRSLVDFIAALQEPRRIATRSQFPGGLRGWTCRTSENIFGGQAWEWNIPASAWYALHVWEHYAFGQDQDYLARVGYPILKEVSQFWEDHLKTMPDGSLMAPNGWSPEHGPREDGVVHDQQIIWELFQCTIEAADALKTDQRFREGLAVKQLKLAGNKIGTWGQLQEWQTDRDDPKDDHRHTSHLFAVYPGRQIGLRTTPNFAKAAAVSLAARGTTGDSRRSWTWPWRCALWARLGEPEKAHAMLRGLLTYNVLPNLFGNHPPFQMDGNFGIVGGITEMLLQSHEGDISLLPALPAAWPTGSATGLKARGGFTVHMTWHNGKLTGAAIYSDAGRPLNLRLGDKTTRFTLAKGQSVEVDGQLIKR